MQIHILSVSPELMDSPFAHSIMKRAKEKGLLQIHVLIILENGLLINMDR
jgi:tRNA (guanine37-N1)-methyltransferase